QVMASYPVEPVVRIPIADPVNIKRHLDAGARSLLIPLVQDAEQAAAIVSATRYPPAGIRGVASTHRANRFGRLKDYVHHAANDICVLVQVETAEAMKHIEAIAAIEGIDG